MFTPQNITYQTINIQQVNVMNKSRQPLPPQDPAYDTLGQNKINLALIKPKRTSRLRLSSNLVAEETKKDSCAPFNHILQQIAA